MQPRHRTQQAHGVGVLRFGKQGAHGRLFDDASAVHHRHFIGHFGDHAQVVRDEHDGGAAGLLQRVHQVKNLRLDGDIQRRRRLIGNQQPRFVGQRHRNHGALAHTA